VPVPLILLYLKLTISSFVFHSALSVPLRKLKVMKKVLSFVFFFAAVFSLGGCKNLGYSSVQYGESSTLDSGDLNGGGFSSSASSKSSSSASSKSSSSSSSSSSSVGTSGVKPWASGIYDLRAAGVPDLSQDPALDNPNVDGYRLRVRWLDIQPTNGTSYDWKALDDTINVVAAHGKKIGLAIAPGIGTPEWVYSAAPIVYKYVIKEVGSGGKSVGNMPLPWDTAYQTKWKAFVQTFGNRYDKNPNISYVLTGGFSQNSNMQLSKTVEDDAALSALALNPPPGYTGLKISYASLSAAYVPAAETILDTYGKYFKLTPIILTLFTVYVAPQGRIDQYTVRDYGLNTIPEFGTMVSALWATTDDHTLPTTLSDTPKGFQMVWITGDPDRSMYQDGVLPDPPQPQPLYDALANGVHLAGQYVEVYPADIANAVNQKTLASERALLKANVP